MIGGTGMRVKTLLVLLGVTALVAYYVGLHSNPVAQQPPAVTKAAGSRPLHRPPLPRPRPHLRTDTLPVSMVRTRD
jgi:hypothetical protein